MAHGGELRSLEDLVKYQPRRSALPSGAEPSGRSFTRLILLAPLGLSLALVFESFNLG